MRKVICVFLVSLCFSIRGVAQQNLAFKTWDPASSSPSVLEGQAWPQELGHFYDRLPARAEKLVRPALWSLSKNSAGLQLRFQTNAADIKIKYVVSGSLQMPHMPATGVSGIDLYSKTIDGSWLWAAGSFSFGDTIVFHFKGLNATDQQVPNREYTLFLPLYNTVKWMEVSMPAEAVFKPLPVRTSKPVVLYGTSIAQGACASRPGLAFANILCRKLDRPLINLGFSGNGRLETEIIDLMAEVDAELYVLDCLPNLTAPGYASAGELKKRLVSAIVQLQQKRPETPILITEHDGYTDGDMNAERKRTYQDANTALNQAVDSLIASGVKHIYRLTKADINQDMETMVDGTHPNDMGMMRYAEAYEKAIRPILKEPVGGCSTTIPVTQRRNAKSYDWETRHNEVMQLNREQPPGIVFIGNSITHFWGGKPLGPRSAGSDSWDKYFSKKSPLNMGFGWDRIENVLWRVYHGELDHIAPKEIVVMIGTNNLQGNTDSEIVEGIRFLIQAIREKQPEANILLMGILPRRNMEERVAKLNKAIASMASGKLLQFGDAAGIFLNKDRTIEESLFSDGLHPNAMGYEKLGFYISKQLK
jgi:lysophospholipase L1-like esterase